MNQQNTYYNKRCWCFSLQSIMLVILLVCSLQVMGQSSYFVDGFHGGYFGHYPISWYTQFIVDQCKKHPSWRIGLEIEPETWDTVQVQTPAAYRQFQQLMIGNQAEVTNPTYAQPYMYNISGESIIRQFQYGMRKLRHHFPRITFRTYASEEPCFTNQLPQLLKSFGFKYLVLKNPNTCWGGYTEAMGGQLLNMMGPDGTTIYTVPRYECEDLQPGSVWQTIAWTNSDDYLTACRQAGIANPVGMCYQDAGWKNGPWLGKNKNGSIYIRWTDYFEQVADKSAAPLRSFSQEAIRPGLMWGTQVLQKIAREVRHTENLMVQAEKMSVLGFLHHGREPRQLLFDEAWRYLMLSQHHDCWIVPYNGFKVKGTWAGAVNYWTGLADSLATEEIEQSAATRNSRGVSIYNTTGHSRKEVVLTHDEKGNPVAFEAQVPAFGYTSLLSPHYEYGCQRTVEQDHAVMENDVCRLVFDLNRGGVITSFVDKRNGKELAVSASSTYLFNELKGYFPSLNRFCSSVESNVNAVMTMDNPLVKQMQISGQIAGVPYQQTVTLRKGSPIVDFTLKIMWRQDMPVGESVNVKGQSRRTAFYDTRYMLNIFFPVSFRTEQLYKDAPFDVVRSQLDNTFFNSWDSLKNNVILHWVDIHSASEKCGLTLLTDHTTTYSHGTNYPLALTVQYSGPGLWWRNYPVDGPTEMRYALIAHDGKLDADLQNLTEDWQEPLLVIKGMEETPSKSYFSSSYQLTSVTKDGKEITFRLFNPGEAQSDGKMRFGFDIRKAELVDLEGNTIHPLTVKNGKIRLSIPKSGIRSIRVTTQ